MKKLDHIQMFEGFDPLSMRPGPAQLLVSGDWTGITKGGRPLLFTTPSTFIFKYLPAGSPIPSGYETEAKEPIGDVEHIAEESFGGGQSGLNVAPKDFDHLGDDTSQFAEDVRQGVIRLFIDPSLNPSEIKSHLKNEASRIYNEDPSYEEDDCLDILGSRNLSTKYTPEFLAHCKAVTSGSEMAQRYISKYPEYYTKHPEILPGGDVSRLKIMTPRVRLIFEGM
jgi:hypothetical protein